jgi:peptide deformylase
VIKPILTYPNPGLKAKSFIVPTEEFGTAEFNQLVTDLWDTLFDSGGIGLSAIQIGVPKRVFVMDVGKRSLVFCNPTLKNGGEYSQTNEGCLSLPGIVETIGRYSQTSVDAFDDKGVPFKLLLKGLEAQCVQHENDHFDGVLLPDHLTSYERERMLKRYNKLKKEKP